MCIYKCIYGIISVHTSKRYQHLLSSTIKNHHISQLVHHLTSPATPSPPSSCRHLVDAGADDGMGLHPSPGVLEEIRKDLLALAIEETFAWNTIGIFEDISKATTLVNDAVYNM